MLTRFAALLFCCLLLPASLQAAARVERVVSPGGIEAWLVSERSVPLISLQLSFRKAGAAGDPAGKEGLARFATALLDESGGDLANAAFKRRAEELAVQLGFNAGLDEAGGGLKTRTETRDAA